MNGIVCPAAPNNRRYKITDLNPHLMCVLCGGYYIDATTIIECLHSFCRTCIVRCLETSKFCPICDVQVHKTKPLLNIRSDQTLQDIVYKLVPGLFQREMKRRRTFYAQHPQECSKASNLRSNEERGEVDCDIPMNIFMPDEFISIALEYSESHPVVNGGPRKEAGREKSMTNFQRFLSCPVYITVAHIKKLIRAKCDLAQDCDVDLMVSQDRLSDDYMLMDVAYMYSWKRKGPLKLSFTIVKQSAKRLTMSPYNLASLYSNQRTKSNGIVMPPPLPSATTSKTEVSATAAVTAAAAVVSVRNGGCSKSDAASEKTPLTCGSDQACVTAVTERLLNGAVTTAPNDKNEPSNKVPAKMESTQQDQREAPLDSPRPRKRVKLTVDNDTATPETNNNESGTEDREVKPTAIEPVKLVDDKVMTNAPLVANVCTTNGNCAFGDGGEGDGCATVWETKSSVDGGCNGSFVAIPTTNGLPEGGSDLTKMKVPEK